LRWQQAYKGVKVGTSWRQTYIIGFSFVTNTSDYDDGMASVPVENSESENL